MSNDNSDRFMSGYFGPAEKITDHDSLFQEKAESQMSI